MSVMYPGRSIPATFTRTSNASPCRSNRCATTSRRFASSVTSRATTSADPPASAITARVSSLPPASISAITTCAPAAASVTAVARPSPLAPPVTSATRPFRAPVSSIDSSVHVRSSSPTASPKRLRGAGRRAGPSGEAGATADGDAAQPLRRRRPDVGQRDGAQIPLRDEGQQVTVERRHGRVVGVPDDDPLRREPLLGGGHELVGGQDPGVLEGPVPQDDGRVSLVGGDPVDAGVPRTVRGPEERGVAHTEDRPQEVPVAPDLLGDLTVGERRQVRVRPGVVA